jgi:hypothetical protein
MKKEALSIGKTLVIVISGFLIASAIEKKWFSAKVSVPATVQE